MSSDRPSRFLDSVLYITFFLTGVCVAAPGAMLPLLFALWKLSDATAGVLLFGFFVGSSLGSLAARGSLRVSFCGSCLLGAATAYALGSHGQSAPVFFLSLFGFALGTCMTSVTLQQSRAHGSRRVAELARLNLIWAAGALSGPAVCLRLASLHGSGVVFRAMAVSFLLLALAAVVLAGDEWRHAPGQHRSARQHVGWSVLPVLLMIPLSTGLESSTGGWLSTYASRTGLHLKGDIGLTSVFWAAMLLCRLAYSTRTMAARVGFALRVQTVLALCGVCLLGIGRPAPVLFVGAICLGWGLGALYPLALALLLKRTEMGNAGFLIAGIGSACLPLMTGFVSQAAHSLRAGLGFLVLPASCLVILGFRTARTAES